MLQNFKDGVKDWFDPNSEENKNYFKNQYFETFQKIKDINFEYKFVERRLGDQSFVVADNKLALDLLKWAPKRNLLDMCKDSLIY